MSEQLKVSSSPHIRSKETTGNIMLWVIIALLPATFFGIYNFRDTHAWLLVIVTTAAAVLTEYIYEKLMHKKITIKDFSAAVTGLLLALNLPPTAPIWMGIIGSVFAILVVKQLFGGLGQNFMNPALGARCFLLISFTGRMTSFVYDGVSGATPLATIRANIEAGNAAGIMVGMCGEAASDPMMIPLLLAFGLNEFSMSASAILRARKMVTEYSVEELQAVADKAMSFATTAEVEDYMRKFVEKITG